ncbi:MAG: hypothetical protein RL394_368 [Bacteroidota bacterium]|jgi:hypothetical protein
MKNKLIAFILSMGVFGAKAQEVSNNESMASVMRSNGKIYVVVAVVLTILFGLIAYLIRLDRKISKLEKEP